MYLPRVDFQRLPLEGVNLQLKDDSFRTFLAAFRNSFFRLKEVQSSPGGAKNKIIVPTKELLDRKVRLKCSSRTGTTCAVDHEEHQTPIKNLCTDEEEHNSLLQPEGSCYINHSDQWRS